jgi:hypothetical protein
VASCPYGAIATQWKTTPEAIQEKIRAKPLLTGVDAAYFVELVAKLKDKDPDKVNSAYLVEIIDRMF